MELSARNQLKGKIVEVNKGAVNAIIKLELADKKFITSTISMAAVEELGLEVGKEATAVIKATSVMVSTNPSFISARNKLTGKIISIKEGAVNAIVKISLENNTITSTISLEAVKELGLEVGKEATAVIKATSVMMLNEDGVLSARNQLKGKIIEVNEGAVNAIVKVELGDGSIVSSTISLEAVKELGLEVGKEATAIIKATSVLIG